MLKRPSDHPAGATRDVATWTRLVSSDAATLRVAVAEIDPGSAADLARLRRDWPADLVHAAIELREARRRAASKFPNAARLVADVVGVEQATDHVVATHKAARFAAADGASTIIDLCCGIGGDAMALAEVAEVEGVDRDPLRAWMAARNAGCTTRCADVESIEIAPSPLVHLDPARRVETADGVRRRRHRLADYQPGPAFIQSVVSCGAGGAVKLGPGVDFAAVSSDRVEFELISHAGRLVQAVLWFGTLARSPGARTATRLPDGTTITGGPKAAFVPPAPDLGERLFVPDPALERAQLVGLVAASLDLRELSPGLGLLTGAANASSPWLHAYDVVASMPWRPRRVRAWLAANEGGIVTVRTRGGAVDAEAAQHELRGGGANPYTVFVLRLGKKRVAIVTRPA